MGDRNATLGQEVSTWYCK